MRPIEAGRTREGPTKQENETMSETIGRHLKQSLKQGHPPVPAKELFEAGSRIQELEASNAELRAALEAALPYVNHFIDCGVSPDIAREVYTKARTVMAKRTAR